MHHIDSASCFPVLRPSGLVSSLVVANLGTYAVSVPVAVPDVTYIFWPSRNDELHEISKQTGHMWSLTRGQRHSLVFTTATVRVDKKGQPKETNTTTTEV